MAETTASAAPPAGAAAASASSARTVTWRQTAAAVVATIVALVGMVVIVRSDGLPAVDAASSRATRWFVHEDSGTAVLVDGFGGRALASLETESGSTSLLVTEGPGQAYLIYDEEGNVREIDSAELRLGPPQPVAGLGDGVSIARAGSSGLVVANPTTGDAAFVPTGAEPVDLSFEVDADTAGGTGETVALAPDGSIWSLGDGSLRHTTATDTTSEGLGLGAAALSLVGSEPLVVDRDRLRVRLGDGEWFDLPSELGGSEIVVQTPGPPEECGWVASGDDLWCVGEDGVERGSTVPGLAAGGGDVLAIAGDAAALVRRGPTDVVRFDWRSEEVLGRPVTVAGTAVLDVVATTDVIWIDDRFGDFVWSVNPWGIQAIDKDATDLLLLGEEGEVIDAGAGNEGDVIGSEDGVDPIPELREPDGNGIDDPPVAVDDQVTARSGASVPVAVTSNDYDPDGEAIAIAEIAANPGHGTVEIGTATTVVYTPNPGDVYVGIDRFEYTIVDGDGTPATAEVTVELLPPGATNQPPVGGVDRSDTGPGVPVVVDVLLNDIDPERDGLRIDSFSAPPQIGTVTEVTGPTDLPALEFTPADGLEGIARFTYRPVDSFGAVGESVDVDVRVARPDEANRPPVVRPDAVRARRGTTVQLPVLVNDSDPDGDLLTVSVVEPLPAGIEVDVLGDQLGITPQAGSGEQVSFEYRVDDGSSEPVVGSVLVVVIDDDEPNQPPVAFPDVATVVVGQTILIDVTANDSDPDGDPPALVDVGRPESGGTTANAGRNQVEFTPAAIEDDVDATVRFTYTITDGNDHQVDGDVTVTVLAEALPDPPTARNDSTFTFVDEPVTVDVLRNDRDPSGGNLTIAGTPGCPTGGRATVTADAKVRFDPPTGRSGAFKCTYEVTNPAGNRDTADILVSVRQRSGTNRPPVANLDQVTVVVGGSVTRDVTLNDVDPDGDSSALRVTSARQPVLGTATRNGNSITYTAGSVPTVVTIDYEIEDEAGALATGRMQVRVTEQQNLAPFARPDSRRIEGPGTPTTFDVLNNDVDPDSTDGGLRVTASSLTSGPGTLTRTGNSITISPDPAHVGDLVGSYTISDGDGRTASSTLTLTVTARANRAPIARDDSARVANGGSVTTPVLFNDSDPDGDPLAVSIIGGPDPALGSASVTSDRSISFAARNGQAGTAVITYQVSDGELTATASLRITVATCQASTPGARSAFLQTGYRQPIAVDLAAYATNGSVVDVAAPAGYANGVYTPPDGVNGNVAITFGVRNQCDQQATGTITIDVNRAPSGQNRALTLTRGATAEIPVGQLGSDDEALTITGSSGAPSWVSTGPNRLQIAVPNDAAFTTSTWTTTLADPGGLTVQVSVSVTVTNGSPTARADTVDASGGAVSVDIVGNDDDPDGPNSGLRVNTIPSSISFSGGGNGSVSVGGDGRTVRIDPGSAIGTATFNYTVVDGGGAVSAPATVTVTGPSAPPATTTTTTTTTTPTTTPNSAPVASDQAVDVTAGTARTVSLNATDPEGDPLTVQNFVDPSGVVVDRSGLSVTISAAEAGTYSFTYQVTDGTSSSRTATVTVNAAAPATTTTTTTTTTSTTTPTTTPTAPTTQP